MFIKETTMFFYAPLSTTTSIEVAIAYSNNKENDYLLELMDDDTVLGMARYFDCGWISDFGAEAEKLFIGGYKPLKVHTVLDAMLGRNYINYLKALHLIDCLLQGYYFDSESDEIKQIILHLLQCQIANCRKRRHWNRSSSSRANSDALSDDVNVMMNMEKRPSLFLGVLSDQNEEDYESETGLELMSNVSDSDKRHRRRMSRRISHSFHRSRSSMSHNFEQYDYFNETPKYVTKLVDYYCLNVINVCIDWKNMSGTESFVKKLLCVDWTKYHCEWIKLKVFLTLFPNLKEINVRNVKLSKKTIKRIYAFLSKARARNRHSDLYRIEIFEVDQAKYSISQCLDDYADDFKEIGWTITCNPFENELCILKL